MATSTIKTDIGLVSYKNQNISNSFNASNKTFVASETCLLYVQNAVSSGNAYINIAVDGTGYGVSNNAGAAHLTLLVPKGATVTLDASYPYAVSGSWVARLM